MFGNNGPRDTKYGGAAAAPRKPKFPSLTDLPYVQASTFLNNMPPNIFINRSPQVPLHTVTFQIHRECLLRGPGSEMRPLDGGRLNAVQHPLRDLRWMSPSHGIYTVETWTQPEANH